ncbi:MAG: DJ-1/PfpI family protein, partial [Rhodospirillales bacterium]
MSSFNVGFVLFPNLTQLDFTGPLQVLSRLPGATMRIVAKTMEPVPSDCNLGLVPTDTFETCPQLDLICVPGGGGVADAMLDKPTVDFIRRQAAGAKYVTSVCTGAFLLADAGLAEGRRLATHWEAAGELQRRHPGVSVEAEPIFVRDGPIWSSAGFTAGIDLALALVEEDH